MKGFRFAEARDAGVARRRLYNDDLQRPFHGARTLGIDLSDHIALCRAASAVLPSASYFSHRSAAVLHAMPLRLSSRPEIVEVSVFEPAHPPQLRGIRAHRLSVSGQRVSQAHGLPVIAPADTWAQLGAALSVEDLVAVGDFLITGEEPYSGRPPKESRESLVAAADRHGGRRGVRRLREALEKIRYGSMSPQESRLRLTLEAAELPSPELNHPVFDTSGALLALIDLAYPDRGVAIEYLGDHHRTSRDVYRKDIARREMLVDRGWFVIFVTAADAPADVVRRVRRARLRSSRG